MFVLTYYITRVASQYGVRTIQAMEIQSSYLTPHTRLEKEQRLKNKGKIELPKDSISPKCLGRQRFVQQDVKKKDGNIWIMLGFRKSILIKVVNTRMKRQARDWAGVSVCRMSDKGLSKQEVTVSQNTGRV